MEIFHDQAGGVKSNKPPPPAPVRLPAEAADPPGGKRLPEPGVGTLLFYQMRVNLTKRVIDLPLSDLVAVYELLLGDGYGCLRYWNLKGQTDAALRARMADDIHKLSPALRDQLARWLSAHLGRDK